jgi:transglutaminase-like putative cysteine protease
LELLAARFGELANLYQSLTDAIINDRTAVAERAAAIRTALQAGAETQPPAPNLDILPNQPAPKVKPPTVALDLVVAADAQEHPLASALPAQGGPPVPEDLAPTEDADIRPAIQALADQLGHDPVAIYAFVRNSIAFEPYYGSRKGSLLTLWERSGSDADIASLLIALLRASGIPARYVEGKVAVDAARAQNWVGNAPDLETAGTILSTGGVSATLTTDGDLIKEHIWAAAYVNDAWVPLDASFKQFTYIQPADFASLTGFNAEQWIDEVRAVATFSDTLQMVASVPTLPSPEDPEDDDTDRDFADVKAEDAISRTLAYLEANPNLTNADLLGGAYIITETFTALPTSFPLAVLPDPPVTDYSVLPENHRAYLTVEVLDSTDNVEVSYRASVPSLSNRRITVAYEAATPDDQAAIDRNGGTLLTTPPVIDLVPVVRIGGNEVARGDPVRLGTVQTRRLTLTFAKGATDILENSISAGDTFAVGIGYGRTSAEAITASQQRLAAARGQFPPTALPEAPQPENGQRLFLPMIAQSSTAQTEAQIQPVAGQGNEPATANAPAAQAPLLGNANGEPLDPNDPANMSEPVLGEMLHLALQAFFNQSDQMNEVAARGRQVRWWRGLSVGVATQGLVIFRFLGIPLMTEGGGMSYDIQRNSTAAISLRNQPSDEFAFYAITGHFSSALEHGLFENLGAGSVSTIRLHSLALERGIPVYRIDSTNREAVLPRLQLDFRVEQQISNALDRGRIVTVSEQEIEVHDWSGVGWIVQDPATGASGYLISGGLAGNQITLNGGSFWDTLQEIAAYAMLAVNMGLDVWGIVAGIGLLLTPEPTLLTKVAGIALITSSLAALGFDIADLMDLVGGDREASQYLGEQINGLIVQALLKRLGIAAAGRIAQRLGPGGSELVLRQIDDVTGGAASRLTRQCPGAAAPDVGCNFLTQEQFYELWARLPPLPRSQQILDALDDVAATYGDNVARQFATNRFFSGDQLGKILDAIQGAPPARGLNDVIAAGSRANNPGNIFELVRARANVDDGLELLEYGRKVEVEFLPVVRVVNGAPIFGTSRVTRELDGDSVYTNGLWTDAKDAAIHISDPRVLNQALKAQAAIDRGDVTGVTAFRFEASGSADADVLQWFDTFAPDVEVIANLPGSLR